MFAIADQIYGKTDSVQKLSLLGASEQLNCEKAKYNGANCKIVASDEKGYLSHQ